MDESLYDEVGGTEGLRRLITAFYQRVLADELLAPVFEHFTPAHAEHVTVWLAEVFGGPEDYTARLGGHQALLRSHLGLGIRDEHRQRWLDIMAGSIDEVFPGRPELKTTLMDYFGWGAAIAQSVSQDPAGTDLGAPGPTPRWDGGGLVSPKRGR